MFLKSQPSEFLDGMAGGTRKTTVAFGASERQVLVLFLSNALKEAELILGSLPPETGERP